MALRLSMILLAFTITLGCVHRRQPLPVVEDRHIVSPYEQFVARNFDWSTVHRVVMMPVANQMGSPSATTAFPNVNAEIQANLAAELQRAGNFEIVVAKIDDPYVRAQDVFTSGQFNEIEAVRVAREYQADAILFVNVTQYHAYKPPRLGLSLLMVSPGEGIAIASISGLWDAREAGTLQLAQAYLRQNQAWPRSLMAQDRVVEMPDVFQRFVCQEIAVAFHPPLPAPGAPAGTNQSEIVPVEATMPANPVVQPEMEIPVLPPSPTESRQP